MIRPSHELQAIVRRWNQAIRSRDPRAVRNLLSRSGALRYVGSAEDECRTADVVRGLSRLRQRIAQLHRGGDRAVWHGTFTFAGKPEPSPNRTTFIFALEDGSLIIVLAHIANPVSSVGMPGIDIHSFSTLVAAAGKGFRPGQNEGVATVTFTDVVGSSAMAELLGDRAWAALIGDHVTAVTARNEAEGGTLVKSLGDGTMSTFSTSGAALAAAAAIQRQAAASDREPHLQVRVGLYSGAVIRNGEDVFGTVVNTSACIATGAEPGEVRLSEAARIMVGIRGELVFDPSIRQNLRGREGEHLIYRLDRPQPDPLPGASSG